MTAAVVAPSAPSFATLYRNIWKYAHGARLTLLCAVLLLVGSQIVKLSLPWLTAQAINELQDGGPAGIASAAVWVVMVMLVYIAAWSLHGPGRVLERNVGVRVRQGVADALYTKLTRAALAWHDEHHSGDVQHRVGQASHALQDFAQKQFIYLQNLVNFIGPLVALTLLSRVTGSIAFAGYVLVAFVILRFDGTLMVLAARENHAERRYAAGLLDFIGNIATVVGLRLEESTRRLVQRRLDAVFAPLKRSIVINEVKWCAVDLLSAALTWSLVVVYVMQSSGRGEALLIGSVFMIYQYAQQAGGVIGSMAANFQSLARTRTDFASADVIWQAPDRAPKHAPIESQWRQIDVCDLHFEHARKPLNPTASPGAIPGGEEDARSGLRHVSLTLRRGERIAIVGPSGSGKSTLMRLLAGLYEPRHGHFAVDGVVHLGLRSLGGAATLISQEADVFEATVRENIAFDMPCDAAAMHLALRTSAFDEVLATMPLGLYTPISERGFNLSGGQRQRLCLARGVLAARDSSIVLLDEPTSALDPITEARVHERLDAGFPDACIVASVHRMGLLAHFDRVVLMDGGRVVDSGTVPELASRQPLFAAMLRGQTDSPPCAPVALAAAAAV